MRLFLALFRWTRRFAVLLVFAAMLALNVATLTIGSVSALASAALGTVGVTTVAEARAAAARPMRQAARSASRRVSRVVRRGALRNVGAMAAESLPYVGAGAVVAFTALELRDACTVMKEMRALETAADPEAAGSVEAGAEAGETAQAEAELREVCGLRVPDKAELAARVKAAPGEAWAKAGEMAEGAMPEIELDWDAYGARMRGWWCGRWNPLCAD